MGVKRIVDTDFWTDINVIDNYSVEDKYFNLYLLTNRFVRQAGIYKLPKKFISFEAGYTKEVVEVLLDRFQEKYKKIKYNHKTQEIALLEYTSFSIIKGGKPVEDCLVQDLSLVEDKSLIRVVYNHMLDYWENSGRPFDIKVKNIFSQASNDNDNDNDNDRIVPRIDNESCHESLKNKKTKTPKQPKKSKTYSDNPKLDEAIKGFIENRKTIKAAMSERAITLFINKLNREFETDEEKIEALDIAIMRGWRSVEKAWIDNLKATSNKNLVRTLEDSKKIAEERWKGFLNAEER